MKRHLAHTVRALAVAFVGIAGITSSAHAVVLAGYDMSGAVASVPGPSLPQTARTYSIPASQTGANVTPSALSPNNPAYNGSNDGVVATLNYTTIVAQSGPTITETVIILAAIALAASG